MFAVVKYNEGRTKRMLFPMDIQIKDVWHDDISINIEYEGDLKPFIKSIYGLKGDEVHVEHEHKQYIIPLRKKNWINDLKHTMRFIRIGVISNQF